MRIFPTLLVVSVLGICLSCNTSSKNDTVNKQSDTRVKASMDSLVAAYYEDRMRLYPLEATMAGDNRYNNLLPIDISISFRKELYNFYSGYKQKLEQVALKQLSENDRITYDVLLWECNINLEDLHFKTHLMPINQFSSRPLIIGQFASGASSQPFKTVKDYDNWLSRIHAYVAWCDTAIVNMQMGIKEGLVLPKALTQKVIPQLSDFANKPLADHLFFQPIKNIPAGFPLEEKTRLTKAYAEAITGEVIPVHQRLVEFLKKEYLPASRESSGISSVPEGKAYYDHLIKTYTTISDLTARQIFDLGQTEVERITSELQQVKDQLGFKGDLHAFFKHLRTHRALMPFTKPEQVIDNFKAIHKRMTPHLEKLFDKIPKTPFEVRRTEAFREASASAEYNPGSIDGSRPGIFYVPIPDVKQYNVLSDEDLFLHEAIPGHHYQISLQQENQSLPEFRKVLWYSAYGEGWALYSESLGKELGLYTDPYQYVGMLSAEMHRAIRLVVDVGIHTQGWTREQAIQYSLDHEAETESAIVAEIERYMAIPGQALSYKIGQLKIRELRTKAEKELGAKFDIAQFHNRVLESGCLPLSVLDARINEWISNVKK